MMEDLETILMDSARAQAVIDASKSSMGMDISPVDLLNIDMFASRVIGITEYRKELSTYLRSKMSVVAPNLAVLIGDTVGARLISHAGSLTNLAKCPASTVQILGAEKALSRPRVIHPNMVSSFTVPSSAVLEPRIRAGFQGIWLTSAVLPAELSASVRRVRLFLDLS